MPYSGWIYLRRKTGTCCDTLPTKWMDFSLLFCLNPVHSKALLHYLSQHEIVQLVVQFPLSKYSLWFQFLIFFFLPVVLKQWDCLLPLLLNTSLGPPHDIHLWLLKKNQETNSYYLLLLFFLLVNYFKVEKIWCVY